MDKTAEQSLKEMIGAQLEVLSKRLDEFPSDDYIHELSRGMAIISVALGTYCFGGYCPPVDYQILTSPDSEYFGLKEDAQSNSSDGSA